MSLRFEFMGSMYIYMGERKLKPTSVSSYSFLFNQKKLWIVATNHYQKLLMDEFTAIIHFPRNF